MKKYYQEYDHIFYCVDGSKTTICKLYSFNTSIEIIKKPMQLAIRKEFRQISEEEFNKALKKALKAIISIL